MYSWLSEPPEDQGETMEPAEDEESEHGREQMEEGGVWTDYSREVPMKKQEHDDCFSMGCSTSASFESM